MPCIMRANSSLKPDRDLLNTHFEGYKFTTTSHTVNTTALPGPVYRAREEGYNYQLTKRACLFNHLTYHAGTSYFVCRQDNEGVEGLALYSVTNGEMVMEHVFNDVSLKTDVSLFHCRDELYLNIGTFLYVLKRKEDGWTIAHEHDLDYQYMLLKVVEQEGGGVLVVTCTKDRGYRHDFYHSTAASLVLFHTIDCSGIASLVSVKGSQLTLVVEGHLTQQDLPAAVEEPDNKVRKEQDYTWSQTMEDVEVVVPLPKGILKSDLRVEIGVQSVEVTTKGNQELFEGTLFNKIEPQDSVWQLSDDKTSVILHLNKYQEAHNWSSLLRDDTQKETSDEQYPVLNDISDLDPTALENLTNRIRSLDQFTSDTVDTSPYHTAHNEVEEIDEIQGSPLSLLTYNITDNTVVSDRVMELAPGALLFTIPQPAGDSIVVSHNVDALIYNSVRGAWTHTDTLHALTHIQASKTQKRFMISPSDGSYAAIIDTSRNIFIYRSTETNNGKLTVIGLEDDSEIIGSVALSKAIILLTQQNIITVQFEF